MWWNGYFDNSLDAPKYIYYLFPVPKSSVNTKGISVSAAIDYIIVTVITTIITLSPGSTGIHP